LRFAFYVSGAAKRLVKYLKAIEDNNVLKKISFVISDSSENKELEYILHKENIKWIPVDLLQYNKTERSKIFSDILLKEMKAYNIDFLFVFGMRILSGELLNVYKNRIINFHPSILPAFPGIKSIDQASSYGSFLYGNTAHIVDNGIDTGPVIMQNIVSMSEFIDYDYVLDNQIYMLHQIIQWLFQKRLTVVGRRARIISANYSVSDFIPNIEYDKNILRDKMQIDMPI